MHFLVQKIRRLPDSFFRFSNGFFDGFTEAFEDVPLIMSGVRHRAFEVRNLIGQDPGKLFFFKHGGLVQKIERFVYLTERIGTHERYCTLLGEKNL